MSCSACNNKIDSRRYMKCGQCSLRFHIVCLNMENEQFVTLSAEYRSKWSCPTCVTSSARRLKINANTPVRQNQIPSSGATTDTTDLSLDNCDGSSDTMLASSGATNTLQNNTENNAVTMDKISALLDAKLDSSVNMLMDKFRSVLKEDVKKLVHTAMESTVKHLKDDFSATTNFICEEQVDMKTKIREQGEAIKSMEAERLILQQEVGVLSTRLSSMERMTRSQNLEIQAVPEARNENPLGLFNNLCKTVDIQLDQDSIHSCRRVAKVNTSTNRPRNILVTLTNPRIRDNILSACHRYNRMHKNNTLNTDNLGLTIEKQKIYVTEHLSSECKILHASARKSAKEKNYKFVWVKYGRVYVRKDDTSSCILIKNLDSLNKIV